MADKKISQLTALSAANLAPSTDVLAIVDTSATETKKIAAQDIVNGVLNVASAVGIGTASPAYKLDVNGNAQIGNATAATNRSLLINGVVSKASRVAFQESGVDRWLIGNGAASENGNFEIYDATNGNNLVMTRTGNLGLGVTPSAWSTVTALQVKNATFGGASNSAYLFANAYYDGSNFKYIASAFAAQYRQQDGQHQFYTAASGTAGNTISFTQALTLTAAGDLGVGITAPTLNGGGSSKVVHVNAPNANEWAIAHFTNGSTGTTGSDGLIVGNIGADAYITNYENAPLILATNSVERARITSGGDFLTAGKTTASFTTVGAELLANGQINTATANIDNLNLYNTTAAAYRFYVSPGGTVFATNTTISAISDQRLKENVRDLDVGLDAIMALKPRKFDWKEGKGQDKKDVRGFIAQEFEQVFPDLIDEWKDPAPKGEEPYKSVRQDLIPVLVKAIQELSAKVAALEAK